MKGFEVVKSSYIDGDFEGFDDHALFKLIDGSYWIQDEYKYWYYYSYRPKALILRGKGRLFIQIDGQSEIVTVREISGVIESKIKGTFKGWKRDTVYELTNGQVWQQSRYNRRKSRAILRENIPI